MRRAFWLLALVLAACAPKDQTPEQKGKGIYFAYNCRQCHTIGGEGGRVGPDLSYVGFRKTPEFLDVWLRDPKAWREQTAMPNFEFNEPSRKALVAYLSTLRGQAYAPDKHPWRAKELDGDPVRRGEVIFNTVGCVTCHGPKGEGGYRNNNVVGGMITALKYAADGFTKQEIVDTLTRGKSPLKKDPAGPDPLIKMPSWKDVLTVSEMEAVADYLFSLKPPDEDPWE